jgi:hypothetical protein
MAVGILVVARTVAATVADANGVVASPVAGRSVVLHWEDDVRVVWLSVVSPGAVDVRAGWLSVVSLEEVDVRAVACLEFVIRKEASQLGVWLVDSACWVCSQVLLRAGSLLHWAAWRVQA